MIGLSSFCLSSVLEGGGDIPSFYFFGHSLAPSSMLVVFNNLDNEGDSSSAASFSRHVVV